MINDRDVSMRGHYFWDDSCKDKESLKIHRGHMVSGRPIAPPAGVLDPEVRLGHPGGGQLRLRLGQPDDGVHLLGP